MERAAFFWSIDPTGAVSVARCEWQTSKYSDRYVQTNVKGVHEKVISPPPTILFNLPRLWYASSMVEKVCDEKEVILVVDDEEMIGEMIGEMVERHGCQHVSFDDPTEALRYYIENSQKITLMITDLTIPKLPGHALIKNALRINSKLPIILVTGYAEEHIPDDIHPLVRRVLPKPFTKAEVLDAVRTALNRVDC